MIAVYCCCGPSHNCYITLVITCTVIIAIKRLYFYFSPEIMFSLFYGFWEYFFKKGDYFVLILGLDNSGKTTFLEHARVKFNKNHRPIDLSRIASTVGLNVGRIETSGVRLNFWDLGGQRELQLLWNKVINNDNKRNLIAACIKLCHLHNKY